jgi:acetyl-CoA carboxylase biotin carboxyl carrier protein
MDVEQLKLSLNLVREHELSELEIEHEGLRLKVRRDSAGASPPAASHGAAGPMLVSGGSVTDAGALTRPSEVSEVGGDEVELAVVKSPIVGTFYRSTEPGAPPFVEIGSIVGKGQVLCIIEAMKLMNEIDSEYEGEVVNIYVENGQPVQYGERLFAIKAR